MRTPVASSELREVMDIRQAADYLGISADTLYKYASEGFIPAFKLGNRWRFKRSRLNEWMDQQSSESQTRGRSGPTPAKATSPAKPVASVRPRQKKAGSAAKIGS